jgi:hypothetical protein
LKEKLRTVDSEMATMLKHGLDLAGRRVSIRMCGTSARKAVIMSLIRYSIEERVKGIEESLQGNGMIKSTNNLPDWSQVST